MMRSSYLAVNQSQSDIRINRSRSDICNTTSIAAPANLASDHSAYCLGNQNSSDHLHCVN